VAVAAEAAVAAGRQAAVVAWVWVFNK